MPSDASKIRAVEPNRPDQEAIEAAAAAIAAGGVVVFPTRGLYGLAADAFNEAALERIFALKRRGPAKPILVLVDERRQVSRLAAAMSDTARRIMDAFWPGRVTLVFSARAELPPRLTAGTGKIGIRVPGHPVAAALSKIAGRPITGTSANLSGEPGVFQVVDLPPEMEESVDLILDAGPLRGGSGSTVVDVSKDPPEILREGAVSARELEPLMTSRH